MAENQFTAKLRELTFDVHAIVQASQQALDGLSGDEPAEDATAVQVQVSHMLGGAMKLLDKLSGDLESAEVVHA